MLEMERPTQSFFTQAALVTLGCLSGAIYCGFLLYRDVQNMGARVGSPIAKLERLEAKVRLKAAQSFVWGPAHAAQDLYPKDSVQTPPNGGAAVKFNDGSVLEVGENSLIVIDQVANLSLGFLKGSVILRTQSGDTRISLDEAGKTKVEKLPVRLVKPDAFSELLSEKPTRTVDFSWAFAAKESQAAPSAVQLEISSDRKFKSKTTRSISVAGSTTEASVSLPAGKFFWRVVGADLQVEPGQFRVDNVEALKPIYPAGGKVIDAFGDSAPVEFNWAPEEEDSALEKFSHKIQISKSADFSQIVSTDQVAASSGVAHTKGLASGVFYWRLVSTYQDANQSLELKSVAEKFQIDRIEKAEISQNQPGDQAELELLPSTHFSWSSETPGLNYIFEIRDKASSSIKSEVRTKTSQNLNLLSIEPPLSEGAYEWRVKATAKDHAVGESPWRSVSFYEGQKPVLKTPLAQQEYRYWSDLPSFHLTWSTDSRVQSGERSYLVEIANTGDFKSAFKFESNQPELESSKVQWNPGPQFWRVSVIDAKKQIVKTSSVSQFYFGPYPALRAPASVSPASGTVYNPLTQDKPLMVQWDEVKDAQGYELTVKWGERVIFQKQTEKAQFELKGIKPGKYRFTISAIDRLKRKGDATPDQDFEVTYGEPLDAPESLSPEVQ
jgi:hypothetical protein